MTSRSSPWQRVTKLDEDGEKLEDESVEEARDKELVVIEELDEIDEGGDEEEHDGEAQEGGEKELNEDFLILMGLMEIQETHRKLFESKSEEKMHKRDQTT